MRLLKILTPCVQYVAEFCAVSSFGGLSQIVAPKRHVSERLLWAGTVFAFGLCASLLVVRSYNRYQTNPTVISMDKNYMQWRTPLPAATFCFKDKYDQEKGTSVIEKIWNVTSGTKFEYYKMFLSCLSYGYNEMENKTVECSKFSKDEDLNRLDLWSLIEMTAYEQISDIEGLTFESAENKGFHKVLTESGQCYAINTSLLTRYLAMPKGSIVTDLEQAASLSKFCTYLNPQCYAVIMNLRRATEFHVHWPMDIPKLLGGIAVPIARDIETSFLSQIIEAVPRLKDLTAKQRKCYFHNEKPTLHTPFYTYNLCKMSCRRELSIKLCACVGYPFVAKGTENPCTAQDLACLNSIKEIIETLTFENNTQYTCKCLPDCSSVTYYKTSIKMKQALVSAGRDGKDSKFRYGIESMPRTKYIRDIMYSIEDLLVSWGGIIGLFLGCSIVSVVEAVYFFTIRLLRVAIRHMLKNKTQHENIGNRRAMKEWLRPYVMGHTGKHMYDM